MKNSSSLFSLPITKFILSESYQIVIQFSSVIQSYPTLCNHMDCSMLGSLSITNSCSLLKLMSMDSVMPSNHLILCRPILLPSIFPSIRAFSKEWALWMRWPFSKKLLNGHDSTQTFCPSILYLSYVKYISSLRSFFFLFLALFSSIFNNCKDLS